jgi:putative membrane protein
MMGGWDGGMMGTFGWLWMLIPLLFWGGLLVLMAWAVVRIFPGGRAGDVRREGSAPSAEDILRERFARGAQREGTAVARQGLVGQYTP